MADSFYRFLGPAKAGDDTGGVPLGAFGLPQAMDVNGEILMLFLNCRINDDGTATHVMRDCVVAELAKCDFDDTCCATCKKQILPAPKLCSQCGAAGYCNNTCWSAHWKNGHAAECNFFMEQRSAAKSDARAASGAAGRAADGAAGRAAGGASCEQYTTRSGRHTTLQDYKNPEKIDVLEGKSKME